MFDFGGFDDEFAMFDEPQGEPAAPVDDGTNAESNAEKNGAGSTDAAFLLGLVDALQVGPPWHFAEQIMRVSLSWRE